MTEGAGTAEGAGAAEGATGAGAGAETPGAGAGAETPGDGVAAGAKGAGGLAGRPLRKVARVILFDPDDRVLLMHGFEPEEPDRKWWFTPGGGLEGDETPAEAALREVAEETGITDIELGPVVWQRICSFQFDGSRWDQEESFFSARTKQIETVLTGLTELERRSTAGLRWWSSAALLATRETVYPTRLAELLRTLLDEGPPSTPIVLAPEIA